jgi:protein-S-isoprenylcysteine O-methyltransferase Ste14
MLTPLRGRRPVAGSPRAGHILVRAGVIGVSRGARPIFAGEAWLFLSLPVLAYAGIMAVFCHLFVTGYEERTLSRRFGRAYLEYRRTVPRWIPRRPRPS